MTKAPDLYNRYTLEELVGMANAISATAHKRPDTIYLLDKKQRNKLDVIGYAIAWKLKNLKEAAK